MLNTITTAQLAAFQLIPHPFTPDQLAGVEGAFSVDEQKRLDDILTNLEVAKLTDSIKVSISVGSLLFDLYLAGTKAPSAPLLKRAHEKKLNEYSTILLKDEFEVPSEILEVAKKTMENEELWDSLHVTVLAGQHSVNLKPIALDLFPEVLDAVTALFV